MRRRKASGRKRRGGKFGQTMQVVRKYKKFMGAIGLRKPAARVGRMLVGAGTRVLGNKLRSLS
jgi:hypothetical protein